MSAIQTRLFPAKQKPLVYCACGWYLCTWDAKLMFACIIQHVGAKCKKTRKNFATRLYSEVR